MSEWSCLWLDATYLKGREGGRIVSAAAIIAVAVAVEGEGRREIVGLHLGPGEAGTFWSAFLKSLVRRGLRGVRLVISDARHRQRRCSVCAAADAKGRPREDSRARSPGCRAPRGNAAACPRAIS